jgi:hypothetical protein
MKPQEELHRDIKNVCFNKTKKLYSSTVIMQCNYKIKYGGEA